MYQLLFSLALRLFEYINVSALPIICSTSSSSVLSLATTPMLAVIGYGFCETPSVSSMHCCSLQPRSSSVSSAISSAK